MKEENDRMTPLDQMVNDEQLKMLKASVPYLPPRGQQILSVYTKFREFQNTLSLMGQPQEMQAMASEKASFSPIQMLEELSQFSTGTSRDMINTLLTAITAASMFQNYEQENPESKEEDL